MCEFCILWVFSPLTFIISYSHFSDEETDISKQGNVELRCEFSQKMKHGLLTLSHTSPLPVSPTNVIC
jgi:hypothetical protein